MAVLGPAVSHSHTIVVEHRANVGMTAAGSIGNRNTTTEVGKSSRAENGIKGRVGRGRERGAVQEQPAARSGSASVHGDSPYGNASHSTGNLPGAVTEQSLGSVSWVSIELGSLNTSSGVDVGIIQPTVDNSFNCRVIRGDDRSIGQSSVLGISKAECSQGFSYERPIGPY